MLKKLLVVLPVLAVFAVTFAGSGVRIAEAAPQVGPITSIEPAEAQAGSRVLIRGTNLSAIVQAFDAQGGRYTTLQGNNISADKTVVDYLVPAELAPGDYQIRVGPNLLDVSNLVPFRVLPPLLSGPSGPVITRALQDEIKIKVGETNRFTITVHNPGPKGRFLIDMELHRVAGDRKVAQNFFEVELPRNSRTTYHLVSPSNLDPARYMWQAGIFTPGWEKVLFWSERPVFAVGDPEGEVIIDSVSQSDPTITSRESNTIAVNLKNTGHLRNVSIDLEIFNSQGVRVAQKTFGDVYVPLVGTKTFRISSPTPLPAGEYRLDVGIFTSDWRGPLKWYDNAAIFNVIRPT